MKKIKTVKKWGIYQLNEKEQKEYGFIFAVFTPDDMEYPYMLTPSYTDLEFNNLSDAEIHCRTTKVG